jgi:hypothetical protein
VVGGGGWSRFERRIVLGAVGGWFRCVPTLLPRFTAGLGYSLGYYRNILRKFSDPLWIGGFRAPDCRWAMLRWSYVDEAATG